MNPPPANPDPPARNDDDEAMIGRPDFRDFREQPLRRREPARDWERVMDDFAPFVAEDARLRAANPAAYRRRYRITQTERFTLD